MAIRPVCLSCNQRPRVINCKRKGKYYYLSRCSTCLAKKKSLAKPTPKWQLDGYKKKTTCDRCGFRGKFAAQLLVYHVDGNLNNTGLRNLKTICLNCVVDITKSDLPWKPGDLEEDR
jgi:hypothetical protein